MRNENHSNAWRCNASLLMIASEIIINVLLVVRVAHDAWHPLRRFLFRNQTYRTVPSQKFLFLTR